jgi:hypothetical protein
MENRRSHWQRRRRENNSIRMKKPKFERLNKN